jgi:hypothetical protein
MRKAVCGRTTLFLPSESTVVRNVKCQGGTTKPDGASIYHVIGSTHDASEGCVRCWHCGDDVAKKKAFPIPRAYDAECKNFFVYGACCSPSCCKAYILEHASFDRGQQLNTLARMLFLVYGMSDPVKEMPPRAALRAFGGPFDPQKFRAEHSKKVGLRLLQPPFVSYCMLVEEKSLSETKLPAFVPMPVEEEEDAFTEEMPPALFTAFVEQKEGEKASTSSSWDAGASRKKR